MEEPVVAFEASRMWLGDEPFLFFLEIIFRSLVGYLFCFLLIRVLSGRSVAQMSMTDLILVIALGSAVGDVAFYADVPILHALTVILVIVVATKALDRLSHNWDPLKTVLENAPVLLVRDGVINPQGCSSRDINMLEVMELLRVRGVRNLGQVEWAFFEAGGSISIFRPQEARPGLAIVPPLDLNPGAPDLPPPQEGDFGCCRHCGFLVEPQAAVPAQCPNCDKQGWTIATRAGEEDKLFR